MNAGAEVDPESLAAMMMQLERQGCHNINFVTPSHVVPGLLEALVVAAENGLNVPLVYNSGGYDSVDTLQLLDGVVDIYMPDFKFWDPGCSERYCKAADYCERAVAAVKEMHRQVGDLQVDERGVATRGLLVRHLVMPNGVAGTPDVMKFLAEEISANTYTNVMAQYRPCGNAVEDDLVNRAASGTEFRKAVQEARDAGLVRLDGVRSI